LTEAADLGALVNAGLRPFAGQDRIDWLASPDGAFRVGFDTLTHRLEVAWAPPSGAKRRWLGPALDLGAPVGIELAFHPDLGPGGLLHRDGDGEWNSLVGASASGLEDFAWPDHLEAAPDLVRAETAVAEAAPPI
jgi:hypothetical protein